MNIGHVPADLFGRIAPPQESLSREERIALTQAAAKLLIESGTREGLFVGGALQAYLRSLNPTSDLSRDYLKISRPRGSHRSVQQIAANLASSPDEDEAQK